MQFRRLVAITSISSLHSAVTRKPPKTKREFLVNFALGLAGHTMCTIQHPFIPTVLAMSAQAQQ